MINAVYLASSDNVVTVTQAVAAGEAICWIHEGREQVLTAAQPIPLYHKAAIADIPEDADVYKYGVRIGVATKDIHKGDHVHTQNLASRKEAL